MIAAPPWFFHHSSSRRKKPPDFGQVALGKLLKIFNPLLLPS
jgi:hypothetical protein